MRAMKVRVSSLGAMRSAAAVELRHACSWSWPQTAYGRSIIRRSSGGPVRSGPCSGRPCSSRPCSGPCSGRPCSGRPCERCGDGTRGARCGDRRVA
jgi:hypothetical protein